MLHYLLTTVVLSTSVSARDRLPTPTRVESDTSATDGDLSFVIFEDSIRVYDKSSVLVKSFRCHGPCRAVRLVRPGRLRVYSTNTREAPPQVWDLMYFSYVGGILQMWNPVMLLDSSMAWYFTEVTEFDEVTRDGHLCITMFDSATYHEWTYDTVTRTITCTIRE